VRAERELYEIEVLSEDGGPVPTCSGTTLNTAPFRDEHFDTLIIGGNTRVVPTSARLLDFVHQAAKTSRRVSAICTGVFVLADAGLLDGRRVTIHWLFTDALREHRPAVRLEPDRIFIHDGSVWTAAGNSAGIDLTLSMRENDYGAELARAVARILVVDHQRSGGQSQHSAMLELNPKSDRVQAALAYARSNLRRPLSIEILSQVARLGPRQFTRTFRAETGMSPAKAVESLRLEAARLMIEQSVHPVDVVARETGFADEERMRRAFLREFGQPPRAIRQGARGKMEALLAGGEGRPSRDRDGRPAPAPRHTAPVAARRPC
jgi:transcriptional regulator GlxA family with amidase domain